MLKMQCCLREEIISPVRDHNGFVFRFKSVAPAACHAFGSFAIVEAEIFASNENAFIVGKEYDVSGNLSFQGEKQSDVQSFSVHRRDNETKSDQS